MTNLQVQKLRMYLTLRVLLRANPDILAKLPNANELLAALDALILRIQSNNTVQQKGTSELTKLKKSLQAGLIKDIVDTSRKIQPYAAYIKDSDLLQSTKYTESDLLKMSEEELVLSGNELYGIVNPLLAELTSYGVTADTQSAFLADIALYEKSRPQIRKERQDLKNVTTALAAEFEESDDIIAQLDLLAEMVQESEPKFYGDYKKLRKVEASFNTVQLLCKVTDAVTGAPIANVTVAFTLRGNTEPDITKLTAAKGGFMVKSIEQGVYTVEVSKFGYQTQTLSISVAADAPYELNVKLVKL